MDKKWMIANRVAVILLILFILNACNMSSTSLGSGMGATPGGVQDIQAARALIEQGVIPNAEAFVPEGILSEYDLPISGPVCTETLCLDAALGIAPDENGVISEWVQIGLSSNVEPDTYERASLATVFCIDISGSMGWGDAGGTPAAIADELLATINEQLNEEDDVAIVTYGSDATTLLNFTSGGDPTITATLNNLPHGGSTAMMSGLIKAYNVASQYSGNAEQVRVMLFTDEQPNVGNTNPGSFRELVEGNGFLGIGITIFGVGLGLNSELFSFMADVRGANAFSFSNVEQVPSFIPDNWPWFVSPIAYNLSVASTTTNVDFIKGYGFPGSGNTVEETMTVQTVFLSKNKGALLLKFYVDDGTSFVAGSGVSLSLTYQEFDGTQHNHGLEAFYDGTPPGNNGYYMPEASVLKSMALVTLVEGMRLSAEVYSDNPELAVTLLSGVLSRFNADVQLINEPEYESEFTFWSKMLTLMQECAPQGNMYGGSAGSIPGDCLL